MVTDLKLPGVDCLAVARHAHGHVPLILITAYDSPHARSAAREGGWRPISPNRSPTLRSLMPSSEDCLRSRRLEGARNALGSPVLTVARAIPVPHGRPGVLVAHWFGP